MAPVISVSDGIKPSRPQPAAKKQFSRTPAWSPALAQTRYVAVVHGFLDHYASLKPYSLTIGEAMFVVHHHALQASLAQSNRWRNPVWTRAIPRTVRHADSHAIRMADAMKRNPSR
jgi:hypothetical protein